MKEHPILFSTPMVQAILEGRKTMTRRIVKGKVALQCLEPDMFTPEFVANSENNLCRYGKIGDLLWVRESWGVLQPTHATPGGTNYDPSYYYRADYDDEKPKWNEGTYEFYGWKPSIHLPKVAARIWLEITDIKVERLQDISFFDAISEGIEREVDASGKSWFKNYAGVEYSVSRMFKQEPIQSFQTLWQSINGEESWNENPWVWVISFRVLSTTGLPNDKRSVATVDAQ